MTTRARARPLEELELVAVAKAVKVRGTKGEVAAELLTDFPERFDALEKVIAVCEGKDRKWLRLSNHWFHKNRVVLSFEGFDSVEKATELIGCEFAVPEDECVKLPEGYFYDWELAGCSVETVKGELLGTVSEIARTGGVELLVVDDSKGHDYLIPLAEAICVEIDIKDKRIKVDAPEGLLEF